MFIYRVILCPENRRRQEHTNKVSEKNGQWKAKVQAKINLQKSPVIQKEFSNFILSNHGNGCWSLCVIHNYNS